MPTQIQANDAALERVRRLCPLVREQAVTVERSGTLVGPVLDALRDGELFWLTIPAELGGGGADVATGLRCIEEMSRADGSIGWSYMANLASVTNAVAYLPAPGVEQIFARGLPIMAGMLAPRGTAVPTGDGFTISGKYQFGSGSGHAEWIAAGTMVREGGRVRSTASGKPDLRVFFVPRSKVELTGNWDVMGLNGTGSFDYTVPEQYVDPEFSYPITDAAPTRSEPSYQLGFIPLGSLGHGAIGLGIALRAVEELAVLAESKRRPGNPGIIDQQLFLHDFAEKEASLQAARCLFYEAVGVALRSAERTGATSTAQQGRLIQANTYATTVAADVVRWCYTWSGSDGLRNPSALGRCMRDMAGATQHVLVDPNTLIGMAPALLADWQNGAEALDPADRTEQPASV